MLPSLVRVKPVDTYLSSSDRGDKYQSAHVTIHLAVQDLTQNRNRDGKNSTEIKRAGNVSRVFRDLSCRVTAPSFHHLIPHHLPDNRSSSDHTRRSEPASYLINIAVQVA